MHESEQLAFEEKSGTKNKEDQEEYGEEYGEEDYTQELDPLLQFRTNILGRVIFLFIIQIFLVTLIVIGAIKQTGDDDPWTTMPDSIWIIMGRFICGMVMHVALSDSLD